MSTTKPFISQASAVNSRQQTRYAVYLLPPQHSPLWLAGSQWLGWDSRSGAASPGLIAPSGSQSRQKLLTSRPRKYGFHATLVPPFHLPPGLEFEQLAARVQMLVAGHPPINLEPLTVRPLNRFLALRPPRQNLSAKSLANHLTHRLEIFRRRGQKSVSFRESGLTPMQSSRYGRFGYPHMLNNFQLHFTLTNDLTPHQLTIMKTAAKKYFADALRQPCSLDHVTLLVQHHRDGPFYVMRDIPFDIGVSDTKE